MEELTLLQQSSLEKVFLDAGEFKPPYLKASVLQGEEFAYQLVLKKTEWGRADFSFFLDSPLKEHIQLFEVESSPCALAAYTREGRHDGDYLSLHAGLFPDLLRPLEGNTLTVSPYQNVTLWVNVAVPENCPAGEYPIMFRVEGHGARTESTFTLEVIPARLPRQRLLYTQWFYADCLADYYQVPLYSEEHWKLMEAYFSTAAREGVNTLLTPVLTPPLNTEVGMERPCTQLTEIEKDGDTYRFDFSRLRRYIDTALKCGIENFEICHLFTQWGAEFAPSVYAVENGERRRVFGWDTKAASEEYMSFLRQFLPALVVFLKGMGLEKHVLFHISDEPEEKDLETYQQNKELISDLIGGLPVIDALSDPSFYDRGLVKHPVAATDHIEPFLERKVPGLWAYNCCAQNVDVGNRFMSMPSYRNRILGLQLYKYGISGFLHWGYNFWYSWDSRKQIDPFLTTDAQGAFPGGDSFSVYPGADGTPLESIRLKVFHHALQDHRALSLLEELGGRELVEQTVERFHELTFSQYPRSAEYLLAAREAVNRKIRELSKA